MGKDELGVSGTEVAAEIVANLVQWREAQVEAVF
jgi:hypothetical protein